MPRSDVVARALEVIRKRPANHDYFFEKLSSPDWIEPLARAGLFASPPPAARVGDEISFPFWPESQYLVRMAGAAPGQVAAIMAKIPATDNVRVHADLAKAAALLPPSLAAEWAREETVWVAQQKHLYFLLPEALEQLVEHLACRGEVDVALALAHAIYDVHAAAEPGGRPQAKLEPWNYERLLRECAPILIKCAGLAGLRLLCSLLASTLGERIDHAGPDTDGSWVWRPAVEDHEQNEHLGDVRNPLVDSVRDGAMAVVEQGVQAESILQLLAEFRYQIFTRIQLHLLGEKQEILSKLAIQEALSKEAFSNIAVRHEYSRLLRTVFPRLREDQKDIVLKWIDAGPTHPAPRHVGLEVREKQKAYWQAGWLHILRGSLPAEWGKVYQNLVEVVGEPSHPDLPFYMSTWYGPTSPLDKQQLAGMDVGDIAAFLKSWQPTHEWRAAEPMGLARTFEEAVAETPDRFVPSLEVFRSIDSTYARGLVSGLEAAVKRGASIDWAEVIQYLAWIADQPRSADDPSDSGLDRDPHWGWARKAVASLLSAGLERDAIAPAVRQPVWDVLEKVAEDPDPIPSDDVDSPMHPAERSINTTRGEAMHAVVRYALWVRRGEHAAGQSAESSLPSMDSMPEVRQCLDRHLDPDFEQSPTVRSVFGRWFPWLVLLDRRWVERRLEAIFPADAPSVRDAIWETYLAFCRPYNEPFELLRGEYAAAVARLGAARGERKGAIGDSAEHLGEHLLVMVGRGVLSWESDDGLVRRFFENAPIEVAGRAVGFMGRVLHDEEKEDVPDEVRTRFVRFWTALLESIPAERSAMFKSFGWWFASRNTNPQWALGQLLEVLHRAGGIDPDFLVTERLAELAPEYPQEALAGLKALSRTDPNGWNALVEEKAYRTILQVALAAESTHAEAEVLVHELGAKGHARFRDLLDT
jgi:hypothetical protein